MGSDRIDMGIFNAKLPRLSYIAFELVEVDMDKVINDRTYKPRQVTAINLAVLPEQLNYRLASRDAITQTHKEIFVQRYDLQPEKVRLSGTFGDDFYSINNQMLDGWERLKLFESEIIRRAKSHKDKKKIYSINYYDFLFQRFGSVSIDSWNLNANARQNANLINYTLDFTIIGNLVDVNMIDALIRNLYTGVISGALTGSLDPFEYNLLDVFMLSGLNITSAVASAVKELDEQLKEMLDKVTERTQTITGIKPRENIF